jgi:hypothetical protein
MGIGGGDDEDWLRGSPSRTIAAAEDGGPRKRNRKIINIDDILLDDYKENVRKLKNKTANTRKNAKLKTNKSHLYESSDEDVDGSNAPEVVKDLEEQVWKGFGFRVRHLALVSVAMEIILGMSEVCLSSRVCH